MKSNSNFVYTTAVGLIVYFIGWIVVISSNSLCWWREFLNWHYAQQQKRRQQRQYHHIKFGNMYEFRPFQLQQCDYKSYSKKTKHRGRGINCIPKPRSGHRIAANETDLFSFGGELHTFDFFLFNFHSNLTKIIQIAIFGDKFRIKCTNYL